MSLLRKLHKIRYIDNLIAKKATGSQQSLAKKTKLSISGLNNYLNDMRELGFPIQFCRKRNTYFYKNRGKMVDSLFENDMSHNDMKQISGGSFQSCRDYSSSLMSAYKDII